MPIPTGVDLLDDINMVWDGLSRTRIWRDDDEVMDAMTAILSEQWGAMPEEVVPIVRHWYTAEVIDPNAQTQ